MKNGIESITFFTDEELSEAGVSPALFQGPGYVKAGGRLDDPDRFDALFFGYLPSEASVLSPQACLFHECVWHALENAGYVEETSEIRIGIYAGASPSWQWEALIYLSAMQKRDKEESDSHSFAERFNVARLTDKDSLPTLISHKLNLTGPSFLVQTACSTSLAAIHLAVQGLLNGECEIAAAGGATLNMARDAGYLYQPGGILSPDGHNRTFDALGKGTVGGDGAGVVVLKLLEDALADNDHIYAVIKGSAMNNDGYRKVGYTAPSVEGQAEVVSTAQYIAGVDPESITYMEAHGTATELGDPVEVEALTVAFNTEKRGFCALGSVKSNIGHLDPAAGVAGFIKTALALKHRQIPPSLHCTRPNPKIDFDNSPFYVNTRLRAWKSDGYPLRAGVSSFGIGGTNVHAVLEEAPESVRRVSEEEKCRLLLLSARTAPALEKAAANLADYLRGSSGANLGDVAYTLQTGRKALEHRRMIVCAPGDAAGAADSFSTPGSVRVHTFVSGGRNRPVCFMFPGQGAQYETMGMDLYETESLFRAEIDACFEMLSSREGFDRAIRTYGTYMSYITRSGGEVLTRTGDAQPVIFAFEYALAKLLIHWGITPYAMIGHSIGEYTAACLSGVFSLEDALRLVALRGRLMQEMPPGAMAGVTMPREKLEPLLPPGVALAAVNSPGQCVVSGSPDAVAALVRQLEDKGCRTRMLHTSHAFHSAMMDPVLEKFEENVRQITLKEPGIPFISNLTGTWISNRDAVDPAYWAKHLRRTVMFKDGIKEIVDRGITVLVEVGPGNTLSTFARQAIEGESKPQIINLIPHPREEADESYFLNKIGHLWLYGISINWNTFNSGEKRGRVPLPLYPFEGRRYRMDYRKFRLESLLQPGTTGVPWDAKEEEESAVPAESGKIDRPVGLTTAYAAPRNSAEETLVRLMQKFFGIHSIGIHDDFFELGGDSLKAMTLLPKIREKFNVEIKLTEFFRKSTPAKLADYFTSLSPGTDEGSAAVLPTEKKEYYAMSSPQRRYYILQQLDPANTGFNLCQAVLIEGTPDKDELRKVFMALIERHETFSTSFIQVEGEPVQRVHPVVPFGIESLSPAYSGAPPGDEIIEAFIRPFDLSRPPLLRAGMAKLEEGKYLLVIDVHHIVSDGLSQMLLVKEFLTLYRGMELPPLKITYKDFSEWQNSPAGRAELNRQEAYWLEVLKKDVFVPDLPLDFPRDGVQRFEGDFIEFEMDPTDASALRKLAADHGATVYMVLLAVLSIWLAKICSRETAVIGSGIGGRKNPDLQYLAGSLQNMILLVNDVDSGQTFTEFLEEVERNALEAFENQEYPFDELVAKAAVPREPGRNPLFDFFYILNNIDLTPSGSPDAEAGVVGKLKFSIYPFSRGYKKGQVRFDLALYASDNGKTLSFIMEYGTRLFRTETAAQLVKYFEEILASVLADCHIRLKDIAVSHEQATGETRFEARDFLEFTF